MYAKESVVPQCSVESGLNVPLIISQLLTRAVSVCVTINQTWECMQYFYWCQDEIHRLNGLNLLSERSIMLLWKSGMTDKKILYHCPGYSSTEEF